MKTRHYEKDNLPLDHPNGMCVVTGEISKSLKEIGEEFGGRNHATVLSSIRKVEELLKSDPDIAATVRDITSNINSKN